MQYSCFVHALAASVLSGEPSVDAVTNRLAHTLGQNWRWLRPLARRFLKAFPETSRPSRPEVVRFLLNDQGLQRARSKYWEHLRIVHWSNEPQKMRPVPAAIGWDVPPIESVKDLAEWLGLDVSDLLWFADLKGLGNKSRSQRLSHYHFRLLLKASGHVRLIEVPKPRLKDLQRQILFHILKEIPPHPSVHGFVRGRSIKSFVAPHVGRRCVLRMDLRDFFPSFPAARIAAFFRTAGYPDAVAHVLAGICTNAAPASLWIRHRKGITPTVLRDARDLYSRPHLPQGAATSPALANLCTYRLDCRLSGLAEATGVSYTRYADDLAFSGDYEFERRAERFSTHVAEILLEEGFSVSHRKTRIMRSGVRQHLAGLVTNLTCNVPRPDFDRLKATLTNCLRHGPETQNRSSNPQFRAHLEGRVSFLESIHAVKGARLRAIFNQIHWPADQSTPPGSQEYS